MRKLVSKLAIMLLASLLHVLLFLGILYILLEISKPWIIAISASHILSQSLFIIMIILSIAASFFTYIKIGQIIFKHDEK